MQYPLPEIIGDPDLLVGRKKEFALLDKWIGRIPKRAAKSRALLARRKSGKTAIVQRIFNRLWSENGRVVPFYISIEENRVWFPAFAIDFYRTFASQFISFLERDESLVANPLNLVQIGEYEASHNLRQMAEDCDFIMEYSEKDIGPDMIWRTAASAPDRYANLYGRSFLVISTNFRIPPLTCTGTEHARRPWTTASPANGTVFQSPSWRPCWLSGRMWAGYKPDLKSDFLIELAKLERDKRSLQGLVNHLTGKMAEYQLMTEFRSKKRFAPSRYFSNVADDATLNVVDVKLRTTFQRPDGKAMEIDVLAESDCGRVLAVEVNKTQAPVGPETVKDFLEKLEAFAALRPSNRLVPAFFYTGGFTDEALKLCEENGIATASQFVLPQE